MWWVLWWSYPYKGGVKVFLEGWAVCRIISEQRSRKLHKLSDGLNYLAKLDSGVVSPRAVISLVNGCWKESGCLGQEQE
jgi:hypothetical protein